MQYNYHTVLKKKRAVRRRDGANDQCLCLALVRSSIDTSREAAAWLAPAPPSDTAEGPPVGRLC